LVRQFPFLELPNESAILIALVDVSQFTSEVNEMTASQTQADSVLTLCEASKRLKVSERTLWQLSRDNTIPHFRVGKQYRFLLSELDAWAVSQSQSAKVK
jgi:excisionase family DNA binding protein